LKNTRRKGTNQENSRKQEGNNGGKKEKRSLCTWRFPYSCVCHWLGMPWGYHPCATLHEENPLIWEPPSQHHKIGKKHCSSCPHKSLHTSNNTSDSIKCQVQLPQAIIILFIVSVEGEWLENVQLAKVFTTASCRKCTLTNYLTCLPFDCLKFSQKFLFDTSICYIKINETTKFAT
jgi:hypothetical protein